MYLPELNINISLLSIFGRYFLLDEARSYLWTYIGPGTRQSLLEVTGLISSVDKITSDAEFFFFSLELKLERSTGALVYLRLGGTVVLRDLL